LPAALIDEPFQPEEPTLEESLAFQLNLSSLLSLVLNYNYWDIEDSEVQGNVLTVITPAYEAFLNFLLNGMGNGLGPGFETPVTATESLAVLPDPTTPGLTLPVDPTPLTTSVPEPATWWLAAAGAVWMIRRRK